VQAVVCEQFGPPSTLRMVELPLPEPRPREVRVRITATGIGFVDGLMIQGLYQVKPRLPYYPGSEFAGIVDAIGGEVRGVTNGDRVFGAASGALAEYVCVDADRCHRTPATLSDAQAASLYVNYLTAIFGLRDCGRLHPRETLLVLGAAGGVGSAAVTVAKAMGARVIAAASSDAKRAAAMSSGADATVDYSQPKWRDVLKDLTDGGGIDLVYDPVGGDVAEPALRSLAPGGRYLVVGFASGTIPKIALNLPLLKRCSIVGVDWGGEARANPRINDDLMRTLLDWFADGRLNVAPLTERNFTDFAQAFEDQLGGRVIGKLVLTR